MNTATKDFLLEINVETLPVLYPRPWVETLQKELIKELEAQRIGYGGTYSACNKNLLICYIKGVSLHQDEISREVLGPPKHVAFDKEGNLTKQACGFAKTQGVKIEDLKIKKTAKGEYIYVEKKEKARPTKDILRDVVPEIIKNVHFPKTMRWDSSGFRFARPVESLLLLLGKDNLRIKAGNVPQKKVSGVTASVYLKKIQKASLIDPDERKDAIKKLILGKLGFLKADPQVDEALLEEVNFMVNSPQIFVGQFDKRFLRLPKDVLIASMSKYQRVFPVLQKGHITNNFIAIIEKGKRDMAGIRKNYENILEARLKDSLFFFDEDTKKPFKENAEQLKSLIFQKKLGNMSEKIERLKGLSRFICEKLALDEGLKSNIQRAAELSKLDLITLMVGEFPSLQGVMGGEYALKSGESKEVSQAIKEHYLPQGMDDKLPGSLEGSILAISDRIDNVVGFLGTGVDISGSFDPFGIRRNTQGLIQIIEKKALRLRIDEVIQKSIELYNDKLTVDRGQLKDKIVDYIKERIEYLIGDVRPIELKAAILEIKYFDIVDIFNRIKIFSSISDKKFFSEAAKIVERTNNILKAARKGEIGKVDKNLFEETLEHELWKAYLNMRPKMQDLVNNEKYEEATREYAKAFYKILHDFFDHVMVNTEKASLRLNRLAMMDTINRLYTERVADLAKLPQIIVK
ncbi:MAG: glycine--tRNA ligase subunit beta [Candidatus Omnitrophica bacterium]|nr:glycine--tRNA ligase subunit beta [Candidatus Omnitrophota bacterium]